MKIYSNVSNNKDFGRNKTVYSNSFKSFSLENINQSPSFGGRFDKYLYKQLDKEYDSKIMLEIAKKALGNIPEELLKRIKDSDLSEKMLIEKNGKISFQKKTFFKLIIDGALYPLRALPFEIASGALSLLKKVPLINKPAERAFNSNFLTRIRTKATIDNDINSLRGLFEQIEKLKKEGKNNTEIKKSLFQQSAKIFNIKTGNYNTVHERALNRLVSGGVSAFFLSTDAFNLSQMCDGDKKAAEKERKTRLSQEAMRVSGQAYLSFITMGAMQKFINTSSSGVLLNTAATVFVTEMFSRLMSGKSIKMLSPEEAKAMNAKNNKTENQNTTIDFKQNNEKTTDTIKPKENQNTEKNKSLLNFSTVLKACFASIAIGYSIKGLKRNDFINNLFQKAFEPFKTLYKNSTVEKNATIDLKDFNAITDKLKSIGMEDIAKQYETIAKNFENVKKEVTKNQKIYIGEKDKKQKTVIDFVISPFKSVWGALSFPYNMTRKLFETIKTKYEKNNISKVFHILQKNLPKIQQDLITKQEKLKKGQLSTEEILNAVKEQGNKIINSESTSIEAKNNLKILQQSLTRLQQELNNKNFSNENFEKFVKENIIRSFNAESVSCVENNNLSNIAKTAALFSTLWFLMADNHNMVMLKSNGEDKEGAELKAKERFVQEMSRLFYSTMIISLFNSTFQKQYNKSLLGMSWITTANVALYEIINRLSVGVPIKKCDKSELVQMEKNRENATGFKKSYFDFMAKLTGKKNLSETKQNKLIKK